MSIKSTSGIAGLANLVADNGRGQMQRAMTEAIPQRMRTLLRAASADLSRGEPPLSHQFLVKHDVTLDETPRRRTG